MNASERGGRTGARWIVRTCLVWVGLAGCSVDELDLAGKACPCVDGWICDTARNQCVPAGTGAIGGGGGTGGMGGTGGGGGTSCEGQSDGTTCPEGRCYDDECCAGCWDGAACQAGTSTTECGRAGAACEACGCGTDSCSEGVCEPPTPVQDLSLGFDHSCAVLHDGTLWCWGRNNTAQLGMGDTTGRPLPTQVGTDTNWSLVRGGQEHTCALRSDTSRWCWGWNAVGQCGVGDLVQKLEPTEGAGNLSQLTLGRNHSCGGNPSRYVTCWGSDNHGQLGIDGDGSAVSTPTPLTGNEQWVMITAGGYHTCAVRLDGTLWCWGYNIDGELGVGDFVDATVPTQVGTEAKWAWAAGGGYHTCAITLTGELWCWGGGLRGQLGIGQDGPDVNVADPQRVGSESDWTRVFAGRSHGCGLRGAGQLWCWGANDQGQLGVEPPENHPTPTRIGDADDWTEVAPGSDHTCGLRAGGGLWCWGSEEHGQTGTDGAGPVTVPTRICLPPQG